MSDVTLTHPVTGVQKTVSSQKAVHLKEQGWTTPVVRKPAKEQDVPDVQAGRDALAAGNGSRPGKAVKTKADKPVEQPAEPAPVTEGEVEAGHAGLQVDEGATNA